MGHEPYASWTLVQLGHAAGARDRPGDARRRYAEALDLALRHGLAPFAFDAIVGAARLDAPPEVADRRALLQLASHDPATNHETRKSARNRIERLEDESGVADLGVGAGVGGYVTWRDAAETVARHLARDTAVGDDR
jgi:hypothetical protein